MANRREMTILLGSIYMQTKINAFFLRCDAFNYMTWTEMENGDAHVVFYFSGTNANIVCPYNHLIKFIQILKKEDPRVYPSTLDVPKSGYMIGIRNLVHILATECTVTMRFAGGTVYERTYQTNEAAMQFTTDITKALGVYIQMD